MSDSVSMTTKQILRLTSIIDTSLSKKDWFLHFITMYFDSNQNHSYKTEVTLISLDKQLLIVYSINADGTYIYAIIKNFGV